MPLTRSGQHIEVVFGFVSAQAYPTLLLSVDEFLASSELAYLGGLHHLRRQKSFVLGRYAAKLALQYALKEADLKALEIGRGVFEQPILSYLSAKTAGVTISHSSEVAVAVAYPAGHPMGVDIEQIDSARVVTIRTQMSKAECEWARTDGADETALSTLIWTAKEALSKALTCGLMTPMEILNLSEFQSLGNGIWGGLFQNFAQYKFVGWTNQDNAMSVVLPQRSNIVGPGLNFDEFFNRS
jgi:4'-phosphopantetheinyl transferase